MKGRKVRIEGKKEKEKCIFKIREAEFGKGIIRL